MRMRRNNINNNQFLFIGLGLAATASILFWIFFYSPSTDSSSGGGKKLLDDVTPTKSKKKKASDEDDDEDLVKKAQTPAAKSAASDAKTPLVSNTTPTTSKDKSSTAGDDSKAGKGSDQNNEAKLNKIIHAKIEELDKKGKELFKKKEFFEAAQVFAEALDYIDSNAGHDVRSNTSSSLYRQVVTLTNNRSAMYEKGNFHDLALDDCNTILELDMKHTKARLRKLRILESTKDYYNALIEVCCIQLLFMQENRDKLRLGLPVPNPPVPQSKLEDLMNLISPEQVKTYINKMKSQPLHERPLPASYTITQLLKSYNGYNAWMAQAAKDGSIKSLNEQLPDLPKEGDGDDDDEIIAKYCTVLMKRGRRYVYDKQFAKAPKDLEEAYQLCYKNEKIQQLMENDAFARLCEWTGMIRHWRFDLDGAMACYDRCAELEPTNAEILVKQAGVKMDNGDVDDALQLLEKAIEVDPNTGSDALLHRANLRMLQQKPMEAKEDLLECIKLRPDHIIARLRLAAIHVAMNEISQANSYLNDAEEIEPRSSEIHSYRGEIAFTQGDFQTAKEKFQEAIKLEKSNPTPYVNLALVILNTPPTMPGAMMPDTKEAMAQLEKAVEVDPMFHAAYVQLGQLKLGTATDLDAARDVIKLYDQGLQYCRSPDEVKDLVNMRTLTEAQVDAATSLKMETFSMQ